MFVCRYQQASEEGCARGTYLLGNLYLKGKINVSKSRAFALISQAARSGQTEAYSCLGRCYEDGVGVVADPDKAVENYRLSAESGSKIGMYHLGYLLVQNALEMREDLQRMRPYLHPTTSSAAAGGATTTSRHSAGGATGTAGGGAAGDAAYAALRERLSTTLKEGVHWLRAASENRVKDAAFQLGRLYEQVSSIVSIGSFICVEVA